MEAHDPEKWQTPHWMQINKDGIRNTPYLEREIIETLYRKHKNDL